MSNAEWYAPLAYQDTEYTPDVAVAYTVPYAWGDWVVSQAAHESLGLTPLTADTRQGFDPQAKTIADPRLRIFLMEGAEVGSTPTLPEELPSGAMTQWQTTANPRGLDLRVGVTKNIGNNILLIGEDGGLVDKEIVAELIEQEEGITLDEYIQREAPQNLIHSLSGIIGSNMADPIAYWKRANMNRLVSNYRRREGIATVAGLTAITAYSIMSREPLTETSVPVLFGLRTWMTTRLQRKWAAQTNRQEATLRIVGNRISNAVASDIHELYCREHFEERFRRAFDSPD